MLKTVSREQHLSCGQQVHSKLFLSGLDEQLLVGAEHPHQATIVFNCVLHDCTGLIEGWLR